MTWPGRGESATAWTYGGYRTWSLSSTTTRFPTPRVTFLWGLGGDDSLVGREVESVRDPVVGEHVIDAEPVELCGQRPEVGRHEHPVGAFAEVRRVVHAVEAEGRQGDRDEQRGSARCHVVRETETSRTSTGETM